MPGPCLPEEPVHPDQSGPEPPAHPLFCHLVLKYIDETEAYIHSVYHLGPPKREWRLSRAILANFQMLQDTIPALPGAPFDDSIEQLATQFRLLLSEIGGTKMNAVVDNCLRPGPACAHETHAFRFPRYANWNNVYVDARRLLFRGSDWAQIRRAPRSADERYADRGAVASKRTCRRTTIRAFPVAVSGNRGSVHPGYTFVLNMMALTRAADPATIRPHSVGGIVAGPSSRIPIRGTYLRPTPSRRSFPHRPRTCPVSFRVAVATGRTPPMWIRCTWKVFQKRMGEYAQSASDARFGRRKRASATAKGTADIVRRIDHLFASNQTKTDRYSLVSIAEKLSGPSRRAARRSADVGRCSADGV